MNFPEGKADLARVIKQPHEPCSLRDYPSKPPKCSYISPCYTKE
jgi:hypothetical protein